MINFSVWNFNKFHFLEEFLKTISENKCTVHKARRIYGDYDLKNEIGVYEGFGGFSVDRVQCMDETIKFIAFGTNCQACRKNQETDLYEVKDVIQRAIAFEKGDEVSLVILASSKNAEKIIKRIFSNGFIWGEIVEDKFETNK